MVRPAAALLALFLLGALAACSVSSPRPPATNEPAPALPPERLPAFTLKDATGREVTSSAFRGQVLLVDFWATWCKPCEKEMPGYQALQERYRERGLAVIGIAMDTDPAAVQLFARRLGIRYPLLLGTQDIFDRFGLRALPTTMVVDRSGVIRKKVEGFAYTEEIEKAVKELL